MTWPNYVKYYENQIEGHGRPFIMDKNTFHELIDSLGGLPYAPAQLLPSAAITSLAGWAVPVAAIVRISGADKKSIQESVGDDDQLEILSVQEKKFQTLDVPSARFDIGDTRRFSVFAVAIESESNIKGVIALMIRPDNEFRHIMLEILNLYAHQIKLGLALRPLPRKVDLEKLITEAFDRLQDSGIKAVLITPADMTGKGVWIESKLRNPKPCSIERSLLLILDRSCMETAAGSKHELQHGLPFTEKNDNICWAKFDIAGNPLIGIFAGRFKDPSLIISLFRNMAGELHPPAAYDEIYRAFKQLQEDHHKIVKGEKVAAILETAVAVNHEINNPLTVILGNTQLILLNKEKLPKDLLAKITVIEKSALRIRSVTQKLMAVVEPITTPYIDGLQMLDIDKSSNKS